MKYMFFDTAINGYYTLTILQKELLAFKPLLPPEEKISDDVAPFIFEITNEKLSAIAANNHVSLQKIIRFDSNAALVAVQDFYKQFTVQTIKGRQFYFRFWAADVFKKFIKTCSQKQLKEFFGQVQKFTCADEDPAFDVQFSFDGTKLVTERAAADVTITTTGDANTAVVADEKTTEALPTDKPADPLAEDHPNQYQKRPPRRFIY